MEDFNERGVHFKSLQESFIYTTSAYGKFIFAQFAAFAQLERDLLVERTRAGLESTRRRGTKLGRKPGLDEKAKKKAILAEKYYRDNDLPITEIMKLIEVSSKRTLYKYLEYQGRRNCVVCRNIMWDKSQSINEAYCKNHNKKLFKFIIQHSEDDNPIGDLASDILRDISMNQKFPAGSERDILSYLETQTLVHGTHQTFLEFINLYKVKLK